MEGENWMKRSDWSGVLVAITTPFTAEDRVDEAFLAKHVGWLIDHGCRGIVALGSLGEGATLETAEKGRILDICVASAAGRAPVIAGVSGLGSGECVDLARTAERSGCGGLMVLPPYVYLGDARETLAHFSAVLDATGLSCMLYNNPIAYGTDLSGAAIETLAARHANVHAVKDSTGDVRRVTALRAEMGDRLALFAGLDDMALECALMGADGWVAGLVNALPEESVRLFELGRAARIADARRLYDWFLPLLRFDTVPKFVQLIKLVQSEVGMGSERVRAPRHLLVGEEREAALHVIEDRLSQLPALAKSA